MAERKEIKVRLIRCTPNPEETIALGAKLCYSKSGIEDLEARISAKDQSAFISKLMSMGHESVLEHASFTFGVEGVSRVLLAQLTRHRIKERHFPSAIMIKTRSQQRSDRLQRNRAGRSAEKRTAPFSAATSRMPRPRSSSATRPSRPNAAVARQEKTGIGSPSSNGLSII